MDGSKYTVNTADFGKLSTLSNGDARRDLGFWPYFVLSLLAHIALALFLLTSKAPTIPAPSVIEVSIEPAITSSPREVIVSPSSKPAEKPPENTNKISDIDSVAVVEQIKRGDNGGRSIAPQPKEPQMMAEPANQKPPEPVQKTQAPRKSRPEERSIEKPREVKKVDKQNQLRDLTLGDDVLEQRFAKNVQPAKEEARPSTAARDLSSYRAFSRPQGSGAAFIGSAGVSDHLPSLPDGDITLLNAKANTYAGFVRRVAIQVFAQLKTTGWERLSSGELQRLSNFATVEAVMSADGKLLRTAIVGSSGSANFDSVLNQSAARGARDPNPPPGARADDGLIHFIFKARSWSQVGVDARSGVPSERRWLLLATGLD